MIDIAAFSKSSSGKKKIQKLPGRKVTWKTCKKEMADQVVAHEEPKWRCICGTKAIFKNRSRHQNSCRAAPTLRHFFKAINADDLELPIENEKDGPKVDEELLEMLFWELKPNENKQQKKQKTIAVATPVEHVHTVRVEIVSVAPPVAQAQTASA
jgi:hypothetical protein